MTLAIYIYLAMATFVPPTHLDVKRYEAIASDTALVALEAPVFGGVDGGARTALLMASIQSFESFYRADVDDFTKLGDHGRSRGLMQVQLEGNERCDTRLECLRIGRERIRRSLEACRARGLDSRLALYASGSCSRGGEASRHRMKRAIRYWASMPFAPCES